MSTVTSAAGAASPVTSRPLTHREVLIIYIALLLGMLLSSLDQTVVSTALPTIVGELGGVEHLSWVITAYLLTSTASVPIYGKLSDLYGRKLFFQLAIVIFLAGSVLSGAAQSMLQLIVFRGIQGLGGGGIIAMAQVIIGDIVSPRERGRYQGYTGTVFAISSVTGPLIGGVFTDQLSWRWVFYINLPIGMLALTATWLFLRLPKHRTEHKVDYLGSALMVAGVSAILLVTSWGGVSYAWTSPTIIGLTALGILLLGGFIVQETRAPEPLLPLRLLRQRTFALASSIGFIVGLAMFAAISFMPLYLQIVKGVSATSSGLRLTPMMLGLLAMSIGSGQLITRTGKYRIYPIVGTAIMAVGVFLLSTLTAESSMILVSIYMLILGSGLGLVMQVIILAVQNDSPPGEMGISTTGVSFFRSMGGAIGVALFGSLLTSRLDSNLTRLVPPDSLNGIDSATLTGSPEVVRQLPAAIHAGVVEAFSLSLGDVFLISVPFIIVAFALTWLLHEVPLREDAHVHFEAD
jgi:EmrB/QacA subfamily drug resistance transporter